MRQTSSAILPSYAGQRFSMTLPCRMKVLIVTGGPGPCVVHFEHDSSEPTRSVTVHCLTTGDSPPPGSEHLGSAFSDGPPLHFYVN